MIIGIANLLKRGRYFGAVIPLVGGAVLAVCTGVAAAQGSATRDRTGEVRDGGLPPGTSERATGHERADQFRWTRIPAEFRDGAALLRGTLLLPSCAGDVPGVVILGGAERGPRTRLKERLAEHFAGAGVAALVYDSPGTGQSTGNALFQTRGGRAEEAIAAVHHLRSEPGIHPDRIGILGISEGALVTMLAAARDPSVAFAIPVSGGFGVSMLELARYRIEVKGLLRGLDPEDIQKALLLEEILFALLAGPDSFEWRLIELKGGRWPDGGWDQLAAIVKNMRRASSSAERQERWNALRRTLKRHRSAPWFDLVVVDVDRFDRLLTMEAEHFYAYIERGPLAAGDFGGACQELEQYGRVRCPVLAVWGENDEFLPPHRSAANLRACLERAGHDEASFRMVRHASHILTSEGGDGSFADGYPEVLTDWLWQRFAVEPETND